MKYQVISDISVQSFACIQESPVALYLSNLNVRDISDYLYYCMLNNCTRVRE